MDRRTGSPSTFRENGRPAKHFRRGVIINLLNPKAAVFFVAVLPLYIAADEPVAMQTVQLSIAYVAIATLIHVTIVLLAGRAHGWLSGSPYARLVRRGFAVTLAAIALWFFVTTFR